MQIGTAIENYIRWFTISRNPSKCTILAYSSDLRILKTHFDEGAAIESLSSRAILDFLEEQGVAGYNVSTIRRRACSLRGFCTWLAEEGILELNPWTSLRLSLRRGRTLPRAAARQDVHLLLKYLLGQAGLSDVPSADFRLVAPGADPTF